MGPDSSDRVYLRSDFVKIPWYKTQSGCQTNTKIGIMSDLTER